MERYEKYRDSGVEWIGEVPDAWEVRRIGSYFEERRYKVSDKDYEPLSVTKNGIVPRLENAAKSNDGENRKLVLKGDFVINSRSDRKGSSGVSPRDGSVSLINIVMEPVRISPPFCNYLLKCYAFVEEFYRNGHGIVADLWTTRADEMKNIKIPVPPLPEQTAIAAFLDRKTAQIDRAIAQQERMIELLEERQRIVVQRAVTRGLDEGVEMRDSGVDYLEKIPCHWKVTKLKHHIDFLPGYAFSSSKYLVDQPSEYKLLRGVNIKPNTLLWNEVVYWSKDLMKGLERYRLKENDLVIGMDRPWISEGLRIARVTPTDLPALLLQRVCRMRGTKLLSTDYLEYLLKTKIFISYFAPILTGVSVPHISESQIADFIIPLPPTEEQNEITKYLTDLQFQTTHAIAHHTARITKLREYRSVLIDGAVTGKFQVGGDSQV